MGFWESGTEEDGIFLDWNSVYMLSHYFCVWVHASVYNYNEVFETSPYSTEQRQLTIK